MAIKRGFGDRLLIVFREKPVDGIVATARLFFFEFDGLVNNFTGKLPGCATVNPRLSRKRLKPVLAILVEFSPESGNTGSFPLSVGEYDILKADIFQKLVGLLPFYLTENDRMKQLTPK